jgi:hypothetical protein
MGVSTLVACACLRIAGSPSAVVRRSRGRNSSERLGGSCISEPAARLVEHPVSGDDAHHSDEHARTWAPSDVRTMRESIPVRGRHVRWLIGLLALAWPAVALPACSGAGARITGVFEPAEATEAPPVLGVGPLVLVAGRAIGPVAASGRYVVWEEAGIQSEDTTPSLRQRDLRSGRTVTLARDAVRGPAMASTRDWVVYASEDSSGRRHLVGISHEGSRRIVLSDFSTGPIDSRGGLVAWAEEQNGVQRVIVREMDSGREWLALDMPRCRQGQCYRLDAVALADRGVIVSRGALGTFPSLIVRRGFRDATPREVAISDDPQPDLVPSSAGALYYVFARGWYRWDFGQDHPEPTSFVGAAPAALLRYEHGRWLLLARGRCREDVVVRPPQGPQVPLGAPGALSSVTPSDGHECIALSALAWTGRQTLTAWSIQPKAQIQAHTDVGLVGVILVGEPVP